MNIRSTVRCWFTFALVMSVLVIPKAVTPVAAAPTSEAEDNNTFETANTIGVGAENYLEARINTSDDEDYFTFTAVKDETYVVETFNAAKAINPNSNSMQVVIYDSNRSEVAENTGSEANGYGNTNGSTQFIATTGGTYYIKVYPYRYGAGSGPYSVRVLPRFDQPGAIWDANQEPNNWRSHAFELEIGREKALTTNFEARNSSYITERADLDWFRFEAVKDQTYVVETFNVAGSINSSGYPLQMQVYDDDFTPVANDTSLSSSNGAGNTNASVSFVATKGGTYYIRVYPYSYGAGSGPYSIRVLPQFDQPGASWDANQEPNNWPSHAFELGIGRENVLITNFETRNSSYDTERADVDWFRFEAVKDQTYVVETFNVAGAINSSGYALEMQVSDGDSTPVAAVTGSEASGAGNTNASVSFVATKGGTYYIKVYPFYYNAGSGPYSIRVLPQSDQPGASWDVALEPNNWRAHAAWLQVDACGVTTGIETRNSSYITFAGDRDWYIFNVKEGEEYTVKTSDLTGSLLNRGLDMYVYDRDSSEISRNTSGIAPEVTFTANYSGIYYVLVQPDRADASGKYRISVAPVFSPGCNGEPPARAQVGGNVSSGTSSDTGEITVRSPRTSNVVSFVVPLSCAVGTPQGATLAIGSATFAMTADANGRFRVDVRVPDDLKETRRSFQISARFTCGGQIQVLPVGTLDLIDPSGQITDAATGQPIANAAVTLYRVPNATPDKDGQVNSGSCRTNETRSGSSWAEEPAAARDAGVRIDPLQLALNNDLQATPLMNPQITGNDGRYGWDVVEGCWYVTVEAPGYRPATSAIVGVPTEVTDLNIALTSGSNIYLPLLQR